MRGENLAGRAALCTLLSAIGALSATVLSASCPAYPSEVVELDLEGCRPAAVALEAQAAGSPVWWLAEYMSSIASQVPGVLVRGEVVRWRPYEPPQTMGVWQSGGFDSEYFFPSLDEEFCSTFDRLDAVFLVVDRPCCDVIPPADVACLLELSQARSPTPLERQMAAEEPRDD